MATQILRRGAAHRQLLAKGSHAAKGGRPMGRPWLPGSGSRIPVPLRKEQLLSPPPFRKKDRGNVSRQGPRDPGMCLHVSTLG